MGTCRQLPPRVLEECRLPWFRQISYERHCVYFHSHRWCSANVNKLSSVVRTLHVRVFHIFCAASLDEILTLRHTYKTVCLCSRSFARIRSVYSLFILALCTSMVSTSSSTYCHS